MDRDGERQPQTRRTLSQALPCFAGRNLTLCWRPVIQARPLTAEQPHAARYAEGQPVAGKIIAQAPFHSRLP